MEGTRLNTVADGMHRKILELLYGVRGLTNHTHIHTYNTAI